MAPDRDRLIFLFGEHALDDLDDYDLSQESDIMEVVERLLPMPQDSVPGSVDSIRDVTRTVAVRQILGDEPPETWRAAVRMRDSGLDIHQVLRQLSIVISEHLLKTLAAQEPSDPAQLASALDALPLPSARRIAEVLVGIIRSEPGLGAGEHVEQAVAVLAASGTNSELIEGLVEEVLEHLILGPLSVTHGGAK